MIRTKSTRMSISILWGSSYLDFLFTGFYLHVIRNLQLASGKLLTEVKRHEFGQQTVFEAFVGAPLFNWLRPLIAEDFISRAALNSAFNAVDFDLLVSRPSGCQMKQNLGFLIGYYKLKMPYLQYRPITATGFEKQLKGMSKFSAQFSGRLSKAKMMLFPMSSWAECGLTVYDRASWKASLDLQTAL